MTSQTRKSREDWANAYVRQAKVELEAARALQGQYPSVLAMLLQMTFEKLSKAALLFGKRTKVEDVQHTHGAANSLMRIFRNHPSLLDAYPGAYKGRWRQTVSLVEAITNFHPSLVETGPQLEYPWQAADGTVKSPVDDLTPVLESLWQSPHQELKRLTDLFIFANVLADNVEEVFG